MDSYVAATTILRGYPRWYYIRKPAIIARKLTKVLIQMEKLCVHYGPLIGHIDSQPYYDMPAPASLTHPKVEAHLRELGFGYRAKYLHQTAVMVAQGRAQGWLDGLRNPESPILGHKVASAGKMLPGGREGYRNAHEKLLELQGVGPKVADCVCLMGLGWGEAVPVDTHGECDTCDTSETADSKAQSGKSLNGITSSVRVNTGV